MGESKQVSPRVPGTMTEVAAPANFVVANGIAERFCKKPLEIIMDALAQKLSKAAGRKMLREMVGDDVELLNASALKDAFAGDNLVAETLDLRINKRIKEQVQQCLEGAVAGHRRQRKVAQELDKCRKLAKLAQKNAKKARKEKWQEAADFDGDS